jgi:hypothetical protein
MTPLRMRGYPWNGDQARQPAQPACLDEVATRGAHWVAIDAARFLMRLPHRRSMVSSQTDHDRLVTWDEGIDEQAQQTPGRATRRPICCGSAHGDR